MEDTTKKHGTASGSESTHKKPEAGRKGAENQWGQSDSSTGDSSSRSSEKKSSKSGDSHSVC